MKRTHFISIYFYLKNEIEFPVKYNMTVDLFSHLSHSSSSTLYFIKCCSFLDWLSSIHVIASFFQTKIYWVPDIFSHSEELVYCHHIFFFLWKFTKNIHVYLFLRFSAFGLDLEKAICHDKMLLMYFFSLFFRSKDFVERKYSSSISK